MGAPARLPANFFDQQPPDRLPANFFDQRDAQQALEQQKNFSAQDLAIGGVKGLGQASDEVSRLLNKIPYAGEYLAPAQGIKAAEKLETPSNFAQTAGAFAGNLAGNAALVEAGGELLPETGMLRMAGQGALGAATNPDHPVLGASVGAGAEAAAQGLQALAPGYAASALGITGKMRQYGKTPEQAFLNETSGINMGNVADQAQAQINSLAGQVKQIASRYTGTIDLQPVIDKVYREIGEAESDNLPRYHALQDLKNHLAIQQVGANSGQVLPTNLTPLELLKKRQALGKYIEDIGQFEQGKNQGALGVAKQVYHDINEQFHQAVPAAVPLDQRIASLLPVAKRSAIVDLNAGTAQRVMNRVARPTGALITGDLGYAMGGPVGAAVGLVAPEVVSSPTFKAAMARGLYAAPKYIRPVAVPTLNVFDQQRIPLSQLGQPNP